MPDIQITLGRMDAEFLLPLILEQSEDQVAFAAGAYWRGLHTAITTALQDVPPLPA